MVKDKSEAAHPVPVVRLIIPDASGNILIVRRQNSRNQSGSWCLPGGKIDYGETMEQALKKELREETSLRCESSKFLFCQDSLPVKPGGMHCLNLYFECRVSGKIALNEESSEFKWMPPSELNKYGLVFRNDLAVQRYLAEKESAPAKRPPGHDHGI